MAGRKKKTPDCVTLDPVLDLAAAAPLAAQLRERRSAEIVIDAAKVERVGAQCLQVLLSGMKTWEADNVSFQIQKPSEQFLSAANDLGINIP